MKTFLASIVGVVLLGIATVYGAAVLEERLDREAYFVEVLVASEDIPSCSTRDEVAAAIEIAYRAPQDLAPGALTDISVVSEPVTVKNIAKGDFIKIQLFGRVKDCAVPADP